MSTPELVNTYDEYNRSFCGTETMGTLQAMYPVPNHGNRLLIKNNNSKGYLEGEVGDGVNISGRMEYQRGNVQKDKAQSITCGGGTI